jgi:hypothetical protein
MRGSPLAYLREASKADRRPGAIGLARSYPRWRRYLRSGSSPLERRIPWITFGAIGLLRTRVRPGTRVFEYGAGGSSLFFLDRGAELISVEHDEGWARATAEAAAGADWDLRLRPPDPEGEGYPSQKAAGSFRDYATAIEGLGEFDLVVVDGSARNHCIAEALDQVAPGGALLVDNTERRRYRHGVGLLDARGWPKREYAGPGPFNSWFWSTTVWFRPTAP